MKHEHHTGRATTALFLSIAIAATGCATRVPVLSSEETSRMNLEEIPNGMSAIFVFREEVFCAQKALFAVAINDQIVGWNASGTYYRLLLSPGKTRIDSFGLVETMLLGKRAFGEDSLVLELLPGEKRYLAQTPSCFEGKLRPVDGQVGQRIVSGLSHARFDSRNLYTGQVKDLIPVVRNGVSYPPRSSSSAQSSNVQVRGDDTRALNSILEGVGLALLFGLSIYAIAKGGGGPSTSGISLPERPREAVKQNPATNATQNFVTTGGDIYSRSGDTIYSPTRGERWTISDGFVRGANGTTYRIDGNTAYSSTGQQYRFVGNLLIGTDGSRCTLTGTLIACQ